MKNKEVIVIGAGLAGCEASYQLAKRGINVTLYEMKPVKKSPAHSNDNFCELVCSNSLKSNDILTASGLLKTELRQLDSFVLSQADKNLVDAGSALAVNRQEFSRDVTEKIKSLENIKIIYEEIKKIPKDKPVILASGPLTSENLSSDIKQYFEETQLYFYDACSPILTYDSIDFNHAFIADRYDKGNGDYINCTLNREEYLLFHKELLAAKRVELKSFEDLKVFDACMPVEVMAEKGTDALRFGPLKPVGLKNPKSGERPYAVVQLRKEDNYNKLYNMVGFQTNLTFGEQKRIFSLIPALKNAEFVRYGVMHRNTFINAPNVLNKFLQSKKNPNIFFAGQLSGVEGYTESIASGLIAAINVYSYLNGKEMLNLSSDTAIGALLNYISTKNSKKFQPMHVNYGIMNAVEIKEKDEKIKKTRIFERSLAEIKKIREGDYGI